MPSGWPYWQAPILTLHPKAAPVQSSEDQAEPTWFKSDEVWSKDAGSLFAKLRSQGFAVRRTGRFEISLGAFYEERARRGAPLLITADALFAIAHLAICGVLAEIEARFELPDLLTMLRRLDVRLSAEVGRARPDLLGGYRLARSTVAVALALIDPSYGVPSELAEAVFLEIARIQAHDGVELSPLFETAIDYGAMAPRGAVPSGHDPMAPVTPIFAAAEWLARAPFLLEGRGESEGAEVDVGTVRTQTRAALLLARLLVPDGDAVASAALARMDRIDLFAFGTADDLSPGDLAQLASSTGIDLRGGGDIVNTAKLDHLRHAASRTPLFFDGSGRVRACGDGGAAAWLPARSMRLAPLRGTPDGRVLQHLVFPFVGALSPAESPGALPVTRTMPSALDIAAWLESTAAKRVLSSHGDYRYPGFDGALSSAVLPIDELSRHSSLFVSGLDAITTWLRPSAVEVQEPGLFPDARDRRKLETALVAWTLLRHDALAFGHGSAQPSSGAPVMLAVPAKSVGQVFVEPHPEAVAGILGMIRQARRGLVETGAIAEAAPAVALLDETESLLTLALEGSERGASQEPSSADLLHGLAELPARIAALEQRAGPAAVPVVIDVHVDLTSARVLEEATGSLDEVFIRIQDPIGHRSVVAIGASIPHFEFDEKAGARRGDAAWVAQLRNGPAPIRDSFAAADLVASE